MNIFGQIIKTALVSIKMPSRYGGITLYECMMTSCLNNQAKFSSRFFS